MIKFEFIGKLKSIPNNDKITGYDNKRVCNSGWTMRTLKFNGINGNNQHMMVISGGYFPRSDYKLKKSGPSTRKDGKLIKGDPVEILWKDRLLAKNVEQVADYMKFIVDLEPDGRRKKLESLKNQYETNGSVADEALREVGLKEPEQIAEAYEKAENGYKEFLSEWDFAEFMHDIIESGKYADTLFAINGVIECQWSDQNQTWYTSFKPQKIAIADPNAKEKCVGDAKVYYTKDAVNDALLSTDNKYVVKAYTFEEVKSRDKKCAHEVAIVIPDELPDKNGVSDNKNKLRAKSIINKFTIDDNVVKEYGIKFDIINGQQRKKLTEDDLTPSQIEDLELGLITWQEIESELGSEIFGEKVTEYVFIGNAWGYTSGPKDTEIDVENLTFPPAGTIDEDELDDMFS